MFAFLSLVQRYPLISTIAVVLALTALAVMPAPLLVLGVAVGAYIVGNRRAKKSGRMADMADAKN